MNAHNSRIRGVTLPGRSHNGGANRHGNNAKYSSGMAELPSRISINTVYVRFANNSEMKSELEFCKTIASLMDKTHLMANDSFR
jgi:hypothetical protein